MNIIVIGGMNTDVIGMPAAPLILRDSNIGHITLRAGGVGRNIAENLVRLGAGVQLITALGSDGFSQTLRAQCAACGIGLLHSPVLGETGGVYLCMNDFAGDMFVALNDMSGMEKLAPEHIDLNVLNASDAVVLDANLQKATLEYIAEGCTAALFADPVSVAKAGRLNNVLHRLTAIKPNLYEAQALTGRAAAEDCARALNDMGVKRAFISLGEAGMVWAQDGRTGIAHATHCDPVCTTGAGDSATAALAAGTLLGLDAAACAHAACRAAELTIMSENAVSEQLTAAIFKTE